MKTILLATLIVFMYDKANGGEGYRKALVVLAIGIALRIAEQVATIIYCNIYNLSYEIEILPDFYFRKTICDGHSVGDAPYYTNTNPKL